MRRGGILLVAILALAACQPNGGVATPDGPDNEFARHIASGEYPEAFALTSVKFREQYNPQYIVASYHSFTARMRREPYENFRPTRFPEESRKKNEDATTETVRVRMIDPNYPDAVATLVMIVDTEGVVEFLYETPFGNETLTSTQSR